jgi:uracil DNA glycosylase
VLALNVGLSFSRKEADVQQAHMLLWRPLVREILLNLVRRHVQRPLLVVLWGKQPLKAFEAMGIAAAAAGGRFKTVEREHPATPAFLTRQPDPFTDANTALRPDWQGIDW